MDESELSHKLVASLYDVDTKEKISDGDNEKFEILDYNFANVTQNKSLDIFILDELEKAIYEIINNNGYDKSLFNSLLFDEAINDENFKITEYEVGRIYALAEIYFQIMKKPTCYGDIIELIVAYDVQTYKS